MFATITKVDEEVLGQCLWQVNRHAKTALDNRELYGLKNKVIQKCLEKGLAEVVGLHYSPNPGLNPERSDVCVTIGSYSFHTPARRIDYRTLPHLGHRTPGYRNRRGSIPLKQAKIILNKFLNED